MTKSLEQVLTASIGKWVGIYYRIVACDHTETMWGILREVNDAYIKLEGLTMHYINRKNCIIQDFTVRD